MKTHARWAAIRLAWRIRPQLDKLSFANGLGRGMPIRLLLEQDQSFGPDDIAVLISAFEGALTALGLTDSEDPATTIVAKAILEAARWGERDPRRLCDVAVKSLSE